MPIQFTQSRVLLVIALIFSSSVAAATETSNQVSYTKDSPAAKNPMLVAGAATKDSNAEDRTRPFPPGDKELYFTNLRDGDKVHSPFRVAFAVSGMGIAPVAAGDLHGTGHHHILIDLDLPIDIKAPIPFDKPGEYLHQHYKHFGGGETETVLDLPPGKHTLRLLFADHKHVPYYIDSKQIEIEVLPKSR